jgi:GTP cyclohydrolase II
MQGCRSPGKNFWASGGLRLAVRLLGSLSSVYSSMQHMDDSGVRFDDPGCVGIERALTEFRAARPLIVRGSERGFLVLPVDGLEADRLSLFLRLCSPDLPHLVITERRARTLGLDAAGPAALLLPRNVDIGAVAALVSEARSCCTLAALPADPVLCAALDLAKLAQRLPAVLATSAPAGFEAAFDPPVVPVAAEAIGHFRRIALRSVKIVGEAMVQLEAGVSARFVVFRGTAGDESVAVVMGNPDFSRPVLLRLHSACLTGDVFGSRRCDCGDQLRLALAELATAGGGIILYLDQEGRGLGLANKMRAYRLQDAGLDTVDADRTLGFDEDERDYGIASRMLELLGCRSVQLLTNNPAKISGLARYGIDVSGRKPLFAPVNGDNRHYLTTKAVRSGHVLDHLLQGIANARPT